jgi:hypothetical protein
LEHKLKEQALIIFMVLSLSACSEEPPKSLNDVDNSITNIQETQDQEGKSLKITLKSLNLSAESDMRLASSSMLKITKAIATSFPTKDDRIVFLLNSALRDKYGKESRQNIVEIPFSTEDVMKINFQSDNFTEWDLLNLSQKPRLLHPAGSEYFIEYCKDETNIKYATDFCKRAIGF